jgi:hypothetical protein
MKTEIVLKERVFEPISVLITLETPQDLLYFITMVGQSVEYPGTKTLYQQLNDIKKSLPHTS